MEAYYKQAAAFIEGLRQGVPAILPDRPFPHLLPYILAVVIPLAMGAFVAARNRSPVGRIFAVMLFEQGLWAIANLLEIVAVSMQVKIVWDDLQFLLGGAAAVLTLAFSLRYEGTWFRHGWRTITLLLAFPAVSWLFAATDPLHGMHRLRAAIDFDVPFGELVYTFGPPMLLLLLPVYATALAAVFRLGRLAFRLRGSRRMGAIISCAGFALPIVGTVVTIAGVRINGRLDANALWLVAGDALIGIGVFRYRMAGVLPIARKRIVDSLRDPVMIIDRDGYVVDCNLAIEALAGSRFSENQGSLAGIPFFDWPDEGKAVLEGRASEAEITIGGLDYSVRMFPVIRDEGARVVVLRDITALKRAERSLRKLSAELEKKVEERVLELEAEIKLRRGAEERLTGLNAELEQTRQEVMFMLSEVIESRGKETAWHVSRVSEYCRVIGKAAGLSDGEADMLANASMMHDIGKIAIPDAILLSEEALGEDDMEILRSHARTGSQILGKSDELLLMKASRIALEHHERWDGSGYPDGKKGEAISIDARVVGVCDVFDSLSVPRAYREQWDIERILRYFRTERGRSFDPAIVDALFASLGGLLDIAARYRDGAGTDAQLEASE